MRPLGASTAVTLDLWHTLVYLPPADEEAYMVAQLELATDALASAPTTPGAPGLDRAALHRAFEHHYYEAIQAAQRGESISPAVQLARAAADTGRIPRPEPYLDGLFGLVARAPFQIGPGAIEALRALRDAGRRTAVISNTVGEPGASLAPILHRMGFDEVVEQYLFSDELPWTKPEPAIFHEALHRLEVDPKRAIHVGDGWTDVEGAKRAGLRASVLFTGLQEYGARYHALFLPPGWDSPDADHRIDQLGQLPALAERLLG